MDAISESAVALRDDITYPPGCHPIDLKLHMGDLCNRLQKLISSLQKMQDNEDIAHQYEPLAQFICNKKFLEHHNSTFRVAIACCLAHLLRILPTLPFNFSVIMVILDFFLEQLSTSKPSSDMGFSYNYHLLQILSLSKLLNLCFLCQPEPAKMQTFCISVLLTMFQLVKLDTYSQHKKYIVEIMVAFVKDMDNKNNVFDKYLDIILLHIIEPYCEQFPEASELAEQVICKSRNVLENRLRNLLIHRLNVGPRDISDSVIFDNVFNVIYKLWKICPNMLLGVINTLQHCLESNTEDKDNAIALLFKCFSEQDSTMAQEYRYLWSIFLKRLYVGDIETRKLTVEHTFSFLVYQPKLIPEYKKILLWRVMDSEPAIRSKLVKAISLAAKYNPDILIDGNKMLEIVKREVSDAEFTVRRDAMEGLGIIYRKIVYDNKQEFISNIIWIQDTLMKNYAERYASNADKNEVKRMLCIYIIPYKLATTERMKRMLMFWVNINDTSREAFHLLGEDEFQLRKLTKEFFSSIRHWQLQRDEPIIKENNNNWHLICQIAWLLTKPGISITNLQKLSCILYQNPQLLNDMNNLLDDSKSCKSSMDLASEILERKEVKKINPTLKFLMGRVVNFLLDEEAMNVLICLVKDCVNCNTLIQELNLDHVNIGRQALDLLYEVVLMRPHLAFQESFLQILLMISVSYDSKYYLKVLSILKAMTRHKPLGDVFPQFAMNEFVHKWCKCVIYGTPIKAKLAVHCLVGHVRQNAPSIFGTLFKDLEEADITDTKNLISQVVALGHLSYTFPSELNIEMLLKILKLKEIIPLNVSWLIEYNENLSEWCEKDDLPAETRLKIEKMKCVVRCAGSYVREHMDSPIPLLMKVLLKFKDSSYIEDGWLRLTAGICLLKLFYVQSYWEEFTASQFMMLTCLVNDELQEVRAIFMEKLCYGLTKKKSGKILPTDFFAYFILANKTDLYFQGKMTMNDALQYAIESRRNEISYLFLLEKDTNSKRLFLTKNQSLLPEWSAGAAISVLAHYDLFHSHTCEEDLFCVFSRIKFLLRSFLAEKTNIFKINKKFLEDVFQRIKNCKNSIQPNNDSINKKMWAACDLSLLYLAMRKSGKSQVYNISKPTLPSKHFHGPLRGVHNIQSYLPPTTHQKVQNHLKTRIILNFRSNTEVDDFTLTRRKQSVTDDSVSDRKQSKRRKKVQDISPLEGVEKTVKSKKRVMRTRIEDSS